MSATTLVIGASENPGRVSYTAIKRLLASGVKVRALGIKPGKVDSVEIETGFPEIKNVGTVTLYISRAIQPQYYDYILSLKPGRVIFNPGTENQDFRNKLNAAGIASEEACTLVMLSVGTY